MIDSAYRLHSAVTDPGPYAGLLQSLPVDVEELVPLIGNVLVHHSRAEGFVAGAGRADDGTELRPIRHVLAAIAALEDGPWSRTRPAGRRLVVDCRTFAVLLAAVLREHGIPARVRFGFAGYLEPSHWQSHVVCEHAQDGVWTRTDADTVRYGLAPTDFVDATQAWSAPEVEQQRFGYAPGPELRGRWTVRWTLLRDLAALTGFEPLTSDAWGIVTGTADPEEERLLFDRVATASTLPERRVLAEDPRLAVPRVITTHPYLTGRSYEVDLVADGSLSA